MFIKFYSLPNESPLNNEAVCEFFYSMIVRQDDLVSPLSLLLQ